LNQGAQLVEDLGMMLFYPLEQNSGEVQADLETRVSLQYLQEGKIALGEGMFEHMLEIPHRLMIMNGESESYLFHGGPELKEWLLLILRQRQEEPGPLEPRRLLPSAAVDLV